MFRLKILKPKSEPEDKTDDILATKITNLSHQPLMGVERAGTNDRLLIIPEIAMLVAYRIESDDIKVLRVLHMKQKFPCT
jgi:plasmid stabilization system protein ParE